MFLSDRKVAVGVTALLQFLDAIHGAHTQIIETAEDNRFGRTDLRAGGNRKSDEVYVNCGEAYVNSGKAH
jgi:hypothetical protein